MLRLGGLGIVAFAIFLFWSVSASSGQARLDRACKPTEWFGNVTVSLMALLAPDWVSGTRNSMRNFDYGCEYTLWRLFYEADYVEAQRAAREQPVINPDYADTEQALVVEDS